MADGGLTTGLAIAGILATVASTAVAYESAQQSAAAAKQTGEYNRQVGEQQATAAQQQAAAESARQRDRIRRISGAQTAAAAKSGASLDNTYDDLTFDTAVQGELDALNIEYQGNVVANRFRTQGALAGMEGNNASQGYRMQGTGSLISGMAKTTDRSYDLMKQNPKFLM